MKQRSKIDTVPGIRSVPSRRGFLGYLGISPGLTGLAGASLLGALQAPRAFADDGPLNPAQRRHRAFVIRRDAAILQRDRPETPSFANGDEQLYPNRIASYSKGLPHNGLGEVDLNAYNAMIRALNSGLNSDFEAIPLGGTAKLANPQSAYCFSMEGADGQAIPVPPAPAFSSAQTAAEMAVNYWYAITRDVPFSQYASDPLINQAAADLSKFSDYRAPKVNGRVTPGVIFRGDTPGDITGPYISQFLLKTIPMGGAQLPQLYRTSVPGDDYMTSYADWLKVQKGVAAGLNVFDSTHRYIRNNRDLAHYLLIDFAGQCNILTALLLLSYGGPALSPNNPYLHSATQSGGITFGGMDILNLVRPRPRGPAGYLLPEMAGAPAASARNIRGAYSQSCNRSGQVSDPFRHSEFSGVKDDFQRSRHVSLADALPCRIPGASIVSRGTLCFCRGRCNIAQGVL